MSSRSRSEFGPLGDRLEQTRGTARSDHGGGEERTPPHGQAVEMLDDDGVWVPALLVAWRRHPDGTWWGRVVAVDPPGEAVELAVTATRLRPAHPAARDDPTSLNP